MHTYFAADVKKNDHDPVYGCEHERDRILDRCHGHVHGSDSDGAGQPPSDREYGRSRPLQLPF